MIRRIVVTLETAQNIIGADILRVKIERLGEEDMYIQRVMNVSDFESRWDYEWDACKRILDEALKRNTVVKDEKV